MSGSRAGSLSRHQMALMALFCTARGHPRVPAPAQPHTPARGEPGLGTLTGGQWQGRACPSTQTLELGVTFGGQSSAVSSQEQAQTKDRMHRKFGLSELG